MLMRYYDGATALRISGMCYENADEHVTVIEMLRQSLYIIMFTVIVSVIM